MKEHPLTIDHPDEYAALPTDEQQRLYNWIYDRLDVAKTPLRLATSYSMKHAYAAEMQQRYPGQGDFYVTNGAFKGAMLAAGHQPVDPTERNWRFRVRWSS